MSTSVENVSYLHNFKAFFITDLVFIDEISMVGSNKLQRVHESLSNMANKKKGMPFGGASVICFGDLKQVKKKYFRGGAVEGI